MKSGLKALKFSWLVEDDIAPGLISTDDDEGSYLPFQIPPELGHGGGFGMKLADGVDLFRGEHHLKPSAAGQLIPLAKIEMTFSERTFFAEIVRGGQLFQRSEYPVGDFLAKPGFDVFRMTDRLAMTSIMDDSPDVIGTSLTVSWSALCRMLGERDSEYLQKGLGLDTWPKTCVVPVPFHVSAHLDNAFPKSLVGSVRKLHCQARVLDYFGALINFLHTKDTSSQVNSTSKERARAVHELLLHADGKLPTLEELGMQFACSARRLNEEFVAEFGKSIYAFISNHRLDEAHAAIQNSDVPLKKLAVRLGYAHFNHFSAAFKKKFGYPPGSLRKTRADA